MIQNPSAERRWRRAVVLPVTLIALAGCSNATYTPLAPSATVTTTSPASEHWFRLNWELKPEGPSSRRIEGYVHNEYGVAAQVQVLAQALDASGAVVGQKIEWVGGLVPPLSRSYFEVRRLPVADTYRVTVWSFDFIESGGQRFP